MLRSPHRPEDSLVQRGQRTLRLVRVLAPRELRIRYRQSFLNLFWAILSPVAIMAVYGVVLSQSFNVTGKCSSYLTSAWAGLVVWTFFASAVGLGAGALVQSSDLIAKLYFPREALPLAAVGAALVELVIGAVILFALAVVHDGIVPGFAALTSVLPLLAIMIWVSAISIVLAALAAFTRDVIHGVSLFLRVGFFASAVMYEVTDLPSALAWTADVNPVTMAANNLRESVLCGNVVSLPVVGIHLVVATAALVGALVYMRSVEARVVDVI
jgi:ABC-2 type transport system permease protein/lipopolysaccharide transport system permease protein